MSLPELTHQQSMRYSRHVMLPAMDFIGQEKLLAARVLVVGLGGLGCACAPYLASSGIGQLSLIDDDIIELHNLQRQVLFTESDIGKYKAEVAADRLRQLNSEIEIEAFTSRLTSDQLIQIVSKYDLIIDCCDNLETRNAVNKACYQHRTPLVSGAAIRMEGQVACFTMQEDTACYACLSQLFGEQQLSCMEAGVLAPLVGVIGSMQATLALKLLAGLDDNMTGKLLMFDAHAGEWQQFILNPSASCPVCAKG